MPKVRLVGEGIEAGVYSTEEAYRIVQEMELDLVEISSNADPPVCRALSITRSSCTRRRRRKRVKAKNKKQE